MYGVAGLCHYHEYKVRPPISRIRNLAEYFERVGNVSDVLYSCTTAYLMALVATTRILFSLMNLLRAEG